MVTSESHFIYLIPGFFGFTDLGRLRYFAHVHNRLRARDWAELQQQLFCVVKR